MKDKRRKKDKMGRYEGQEKEKGQNGKIWENQKNSYSLNCGRRCKEIRNEAKRKKVEV